MSDICRHCLRKIDVHLDKDNVLRWTHTDGGAMLCAGTYAEPANRLAAK